MAWDSKKWEYKTLKRVGFVGADCCFFSIGIDDCQSAIRPGTMKILCWNVHELGSPWAIQRLRQMVKFDYPRMLFFMETKLDENRMEKVGRRCGFNYGIEVEANGSRGFYGAPYASFTGFYGAPYASFQEETWNLLRRLGNEKKFPWLVCGDFNEVLYSFEKVGGVPREEHRIEAFRKTLDDCQLRDIEYSGNWFTWERGNRPETNIKELLDRRVANDDWLTLIDVKIQLNFELDKDEAFWEKRAIVNWLHLGDKDTSFFHRYASTRKKNAIGSLEREDGKVVSTEDEIGEFATKYFQNMFSLNGIGDLSYILSEINTNIFLEENLFLLAKFTEEDVYTALK
ncbi:hypothetical protein PVK06_024467 [Gossypium arboreum]|uniref:Reverse transcriptase n=1 Tax=Gossypium arboreum TaxID=29729 RepID=A0ABR0PDW9_GOSAR|nr:hypothetical protein PVK06_024467 [Gossypium arboreum]